MLLFCGRLPACRTLIPPKSPLFCGLLPTRCGSVIIYLPGAVKGVLELFPGSLHFILIHFVYDITTSYSVIPHPNRRAIWPPSLPPIHSFPFLCSAPWGAAQAFRCSDDSYPLLRNTEPWCLWYPLRKLEAGMSAVHNFCTNICLPMGKAA